jgi:type I restriction enzyme S subunit
MASEWRTVEFGQLLNEPVRNGIYKPSEYHGRGAKIVNMGELFANPRLGPVPMKRIEVTDEEYSRFGLSAGDLIFARRSLVAEGAGKCSIILETDWPTVFESSIIRARPNPALADPRFLYYYFNSPLGLHGLDTIRRQVAVAGITGTDLMRLHLHLPLLAEQRQIGSVLGALDDKIELNRRVSQTLESMARALFKSWFVDFDPVRAKAEGRDTGLSDDIAELFPDSFDYSEVGEIPSRWTVSPVSELAVVVGGSTPRTEEAAFWENGHHWWATPKDLSGLSTPVLLSTERRITDAGLAQISSGLLPPGTVLISSRAPIGYLAIAEVPVAINQGFIALRPRPEFSNLFLLHWAEWAHDEIVSRANGSTFLEISKSSFRPIPVPVPPGQVVNAFDLQVRPLYSRVVSNERESDSLVMLRNALLPELISGRVSTAEASGLAEVDR